MDTVWWLELLTRDNLRLTHVLLSYIPLLECWRVDDDGHPARRDWTWLARVPEHIHAAFFMHLPACAAVVSEVRRWMLASFPRATYLECLAWLVAAGQADDVCDVPIECSSAMWLEPDTLAPLVHHPLARRYVCVDWRDQVQKARMHYRTKHTIY
jgi:hypothetical protein